MNSDRRGFTLIELLVVIAIIGLLASVVLASLNKARVRSRDTRRLADIVEIQKALELYANDNHGNYPCESNCNSGNGIDVSTALAALAPSYIQHLPVDPTGHEYQYRSKTAGGPSAPNTTYCIAIAFENATNLPPSPDRCDNQDKVNGLQNEYETGSN
jgi:type II secretion system protein G